LAGTTALRLLALDDDRLIARGGSHADRGTAGAAVALAGTALFACARAGTRLRLRELEATDRRIGRDGSHPSRPAARPWRRAGLADEILAEGDSDSCRGSKDDFKYSHLFLLRRIPPREIILLAKFGFPAEQKFWMNRRISWSLLGGAAALPLAARAATAQKSAARLE
jgi:hypothetical protein